VICDITISLLIKFNGEANSQTKFAIQTTSTAGIVIMAFGILCIWIVSSINLQEEGEGFMIIG
jgi:hypothetical protein